MFAFQQPSAVATSLMDTAGGRVGHGTGNAERRRAAIWFRWEAHRGDGPGLFEVRGLPLGRTLFVRSDNARVISLPPLHPRRMSSSAGDAPPPCKPARTSSVCAATRTAGFASAQHRSELLLFYRLPCNPWMVDQFVLQLQVLRVSLEGNGTQTSPALTCIPPPQPRGHWEGRGGHFCRRP